MLIVLNDHLQPAYPPEIFRYWLYQSKQLTVNDFRGSKLIKPVTNKKLMCVC